MNYNFTDETRHALAFARKVALQWGHEHVDTEHLLLGLLRMDRRVTSHILRTLAVPPPVLINSIDARVTRRRSYGREGELPYASGAKEVLKQAMAAARDLKDDYVGTEHILLGLIREEQGIAAQVLISAGVTLERAHEALSEVRRAAEENRPPVPLPPKPEESGPVWFLEVDDSSDQPIYEQIIARIEEAVATGRLEPEERLPPVRQLAEELGIAPGTVARAYSELEKRGVLETEGARGTRVAARSAGKGRVEDRIGTLEGLMRPVVVAAYHLGATAGQLRRALDRAMKGIFGFLA